MSTGAPSPPPRKLPRLTPETRAFWTGGERGELLIRRCTTCGLYHHPPLPLCPACRTETAVPTPVSGRGRIRTFTVNRQQWLPGEDPTFVFAAVELEEQAELYVFSNILVPPDEVRSGMKVRVCFERQDDVWLPLFRPEEPANAA